DAVGDDTPHRLDDLVSPAVVEGNVERQSVIVARAFNSFVDFALQNGRQALQPSQVAQLNAVRIQVIQFVVNDAFQDVHQAAHFRLRAAPVFRGEGVDGQDFDAELAAGAQNTAQILHACLVPGQPGHPARLRPPSVAIHDDGKVVRHTLRPYL